MQERRGKKGFFAFFDFKGNVSRLMVGKVFDSEGKEGCCWALVNRGIEKKESWR